MKRSTNLGYPRKNIDEPCCYHVTHRCQERSFLLNFKKDRRNYLSRLLEASRIYDVSVLDYIVTSNHVHILFHASAARSVSEAMRHIQGNSARDYNRRKEREGAFWRGRYRPTLIQNGPHLARCIFYIDMNMVRAGICAHPSEWSESGYHELAGKRQRNLIIDRKQLFDCMMGTWGKNEFAAWYEANINDCLKTQYRVREALWSESLAVGQKEWLEKIGRGVHGALIEPVGESCIRAGEEPSLYRLTGSARTGQAFWENLQKKA